jgi:hypothetical protein
VPAVGDDPRPSLHNDDLGGEPVHHRRHQRLVVFAAIVLAGLFVNYLVNLTGKLSVRYGIPYADFLRRAAPHPAGLRSVQHGPEPSVPLRQRLEPAGVRPFAVAAVFSVATVWVPWLAELSRFAWVIGAVIRGRAVHRGDGRPYTGRIRPVDSGESGAGDDRTDDGTDIEQLTVSLGLLAG